VRVGLQMYSVRGEMSRYALDTISAVIDIGYHHLEFANLRQGDVGIGFDADPQELRSTIQTAGAEVTSCHLWGIDESRLDELIEFHQALGTRYLVSKFLYRDLDAIIDMAKQFVRVGDKFRQAGIRHTVHTSLMRSQDGRTDLDELLDRVPAELIDVELDTYWAYRSGLDPVELMKRHGERIRILHLKDLPAHIRQPVNIVATWPDDFPNLPEYYYANTDYIEPDNFIEVGDGVLPLQKMIDAANQYCRAEYVLVEQDFTKLTELDSVSRSLDSLRGLQGVTV
jgi:sugar phosphate isomerase/epimerase